MKKPSYEKTPSEEQLLALLKGVECGRISVELDEKTSAESVRQENGIYHYHTSNKWRVGVYVDCGEFDYIDYIQHGGKRIDYGRLEKYYPKVVQHANRFRNKNLAKRVWGIEAKLFAGV